MRFACDPEVDILIVHLQELQEGQTVATSKEVAPGVVVDLDEHGAPVDIEILDAARRYPRPDLEAVDINANLLSLGEAAQKTGLSANTLKIQAQNGRLKARKVGRNWVTSEAWLREYLNSRRYNAKETAIS